MPKGKNLPVPIRKLIYYDFMYNGEHIDIIYNRYKNYVSMARLEKLRALFNKNPVASSSYIEEKLIPDDPESMKGIKLSWSSSFCFH
jgi:hypothetical protein